MSGRAASASTLAGWLHLRSSRRVPPSSGGRRRRLPYSWLWSGDEVHPGSRNAGHPFTAPYIEAAGPKRRPRREHAMTRGIAMKLIWAVIIVVLALPTSRAAKSAGLAASGSGERSGGAFPPGYTVTRAGGVHDFDYFEGAWATRQRRLKARGVGSNEWEEFPATLCMSLYLGGLATVDEIYFPTKGWAGLTLRTFDLEKHQWSIYWVSSARGKLEAPVVGGFDGAQGYFYGEDQDNGRAVKVRYTWKKIERNDARWEQAFSYDNHTWETNWTADFMRTDPAAACEVGRPRR